MKIITYRRVVVTRTACPVCYEPAVPHPPLHWLAFHGPRPAWSHVDGEPLCPVTGPAGGSRPAQRPCLVTAVRPARPRRLRSRAVPCRTTARYRLTGAARKPVPGGVDVFIVAGGDMVAVFDSADAADIMAVTMTAANLEPVTMRVTEAQWAQAHAVLRTQQPHITVTDARPTRTAGAP